MFNQNLLSLSTTITVGLLCTAATGITLYYTTRYVLLDHHQTVSKRSLKRTSLKMQESLIQLEKNITAASQNLVTLEEDWEDMDPILLDRQLKEMELESIGRLEALDAILPSSLGADSETLMDLKLESWVAQNIESLKDHKKDLIRRVQEDMDKLDRLCVLAKIPLVSRMHALPSLEAPPSRLSDQTLTSEEPSLIKDPLV